MEKNRILSQSLNHSISHSPSLFDAPWKSSAFPVVSCASEPMNGVCVCCCMTKSAYILGGNESNNTAVNHADEVAHVFKHTHKKLTCQSMWSLTTNWKSWWSSHKLQKQTLFGRVVHRQYFKETLNCWWVQCVAMIWTTGFHQILDGPWFKWVTTEQLVQLHNTITTHHTPMKTLMVNLCALLTL